MDEARESRRNLQCIADAVMPHSATARAVMGAYNDAIQALANAADLLWRAGELRFCAALETKVTDIELQARRHLDSIEARERCGCGKWLDDCGPKLWDRGEKCCDGCTHIHTRSALGVTL
jgi:hypothetical protein